MIGNKCQNTNTSDVKSFLKWIFIYFDFRVTLATINKPRLLCSDSFFVGGPSSRTDINSIPIYPTLPTPVLSTYNRDHEYMVRNTYDLFSLVFVWNRLSIMFKKKKKKRYSIVSSFVSVFNIRIAGHDRNRKVYFSGGGSDYLSGKTFLINHIDRIGFNGRKIAKIREKKPQRSTVLSISRRYIIILIIIFIY